ncbi:hypothetical protein LAZ67_2003089 [Cordylochernes scorpioides]|uniref:Uncharacterized protein n=1 Tax=Cordylochernes scorpioides TaxID=51811 RepID=A0ABY6K3D7_9ARAC|nr:hypothetical protein LAZ67_2003089 [Cordylochernes scorpioides]
MRCLRLEASALNGYLERWSFRSTEGVEDELPDLSCELEQVLGPSGDVCMEELSADDLMHVLGSSQDVCMPDELSHLSPLDIEQVLVRSTEGVEDELPDLSCELEQVLGPSGDICMEELSADDLMHVLGSPQDVCMPGELQVLRIPDQDGLDNAPTVDDLTLSRILEAEFHFSSLEEKLDSFEADIIDILQQALQRHKTIRFFLQTEVELIKTNDASDPESNIVHKEIYRGENPAEKFLLSLFSTVSKLKERLRNYPSVDMNEQQKIDFLNEQTCHICKKQLDIKTKVIDHCHWSEKYSVILVDDVIFLDSFQFLSASLNTLSSNLPQDGFKGLSQCFPYQTDLLHRKGVYPYEYMTDSSKFSETSLPPIEYFSSKLLNESCSNESYAFAQQVWEELNCTTLGDYHDIYLIGDVWLF